MTVNCVMVTYNSASTVSAALGSVRPAHDDGWLRCTVIDNCSSDSTVSIVRAQHPWVHLIRSDANLGFGAACNLALSCGRSRFHLLLNPDAVLPSSELAQLVEFMSAHPEAGLVAPAVLEPGGALQHAGGLPRLPWAQAVLSGRGDLSEREIEPGSPPFQTNWLCGAVLLIRDELLCAVGGFDPRFFLYYEETDLCRRAADAGFELWANGRVVAEHVTAGSSSGARRDLYEGCIPSHFFRSRLYYFAKHHGHGPAVLAEVIEYLKSAVRAIGLLGRGRPLGKVCVHLAHGLPRLPRRRRLPGPAPGSPLSGSVGRGQDAWNAVERERADARSVPRAPRTAQGARRHSSRSTAILTGHGRSGTNWLLDLLDLSPWTFCRSEPNETADSPLSQLVSPIARRDAWPDLDALWNAAIQRCGRTMGERDRPIRHRKDYLYAWSQSLQLAPSLSRRRIRRALALLQPDLAGGEWALPRWLGSRRRLGDASVILKMVLVPGWMDWVLRQRPEQRVLHVVRHPGGFLRSWQRRYLAKNDPSSVRRACVDRIEMVRRCDPAVEISVDAAREMSVEEAELWYWRYANEVILEAGRQSSVYHLTTFEQIAEDPTGEMRRIYEFLDVPWSARVEAGVRSMSGGSRKIGRAWRETLDRRDVSRVEASLEGSPLGALWD